jgi:hypothetical protein
LIENYDDAIDWIITITFYCALHFVQAKLEKDFNSNPRFHTNRNPKLSRKICVSKYLPTNISTLYTSLYNESMKARYTEQGVYRDIKTYKKMHPLILEAKNEFPNLITSKR